jgi:hypothetical protein
MITTTVWRALHNHEDWKIGFMKRDFKDFSGRPAGVANRLQRQLFERISASFAFVSEARRHGRKKCMSANEANFQSSHGEGS